MVREILLTGAENAKSSKDLCGVLHLTRRELTKAVERERRQGAPICARADSAAPGYYLAADKGEMMAFCRSLHHRASEVYKTRRALLATIDNLPAGAGSGEG